MAKKRVHEVAKEIDIESKILIKKLGEMGISVKSSLSTLEEKEIGLILKEFGKGSKPEPPGESAKGGKTERAGEGIKASKPEKTREASKGEKTGEAKRAASRMVEEKKAEEIKAEEIKVEEKLPAGIRQDRQPEKKREAPPRDDKKRGGHKRTDQQWPGMVDRVPSRPPDRRFTDRPASAGNQPVRSGMPVGQQQGVPQSKAGEPLPERVRQERTQPERPKQDRPPFDRPRTDRPPQDRAPRPGQPPQDRAARPGQPNYDRPGQSRPPQDRPRPDRPPFERQQDAALRRNPAAAPSDRPAAGAVRPGQDPNRNRPGAPAAGRPHQRPPGGWGQPAPRGPRPPQPAGQMPAGQARPKPDQQRPLAVPAPPVTDKPKIGEKPKPAKPVAKKGRLDKRAAIAAQAEEKLRQRAGQRKKGQQRFQTPVRIAQPIEKKPVVLGESATVQELAQKLYKSPAELIKKLMHLGLMATINQEIDIDTATILANEFGYEVEIKLPVDYEALLMQETEDDPSLLAPRPCVVTVMGHVDHGKTTLLDAIRETNVTATEAGGITQHIGAYQVEHNNKKITFVDTPGHEAFTAMRARGANVTDIVVLVVAADDGVMPQTVEAINHAKEAKVPIIVAVNKIDKPGANPDRVKRELTEHGLVAEDWGGDTISVEVSALKKMGINELLEMILLVAEIGEYKANPTRPARGTVVEAELDKGRGPVATVLVQNGMLNIGDTLIAGPAFCRVRAMMDDKGRRIKRASPSTPVEVLGFSEVPVAGDVFVAVPDEKLARTVVSRRQVKKREEEMRTTARVSLDDLFKRIKEGQIKELGIIIKGDVQGSVEALRQSLERLNTGEVKVNIIHGGVGAISETDIMLASASDAIVIGFNVRPDVNARKAIDVEKVDVRLYRVIYDAIEDVKKAMSGLLEPEYREVTLGRAEIRKVFRASKIGAIAGCYVIEGKIERDAKVRVVRDGIVVYEGKLDSLKRFKDDVKEVAQGYECGIAMEKFNEIQEGDIIEAFNMEAIKRELE
ncbi:MAG: translation initiation factor IF-2 [Eubacteriales bacterium]